MSKPIKLTNELSAQIVAGIRAGAYPHIAAEASGVTKDVFDAWLARGNRAGSRHPYRTFARGVREAFAHARLFAEIAELRAKPERWLIHGPGRESKKRPGWSTSVKPADAKPVARNVLQDPDIMRLFRIVLNVLSLFPEARQKVADALSEVGFKFNKEKTDGAKSVQDDSDE